ncbi:MAG: helix-turn-helix domain-containing protein [Micrococcales bacterium]|nr:helix-turn-helix domain-containing protein [Micrococcales bacterium]
MTGTALAPQTDQVRGTRPNSTDYYWRDHLFTANLKYATKLMGKPITPKWLADILLIDNDSASRLLANQAEWWSPDDMMGPGDKEQICNQFGLNWSTMEEAHLDSGDYESGPTVATIDLDAGQLNALQEALVCLLDNSNIDSETDNAITLLITATRAELRARAAKARKHKSPANLDAPALRAVIAGKTRDALRASGLSRRQVAEKTGIPCVTLSRKLAGHSDFGISELWRVADAIGAHVSDLVAV